MLVLGSLNGIRNSACRFTWNLTIQIQVVGASFGNEAANDCAEEDHVSDDGKHSGFPIPDRWARNALGLISIRFTRAKRRKL
jgi:hypothetical protein